MLITRLQRVGLILGIWFLGTAPLVLVKPDAAEAISRWSPVPGNVFWSPFAGVYSHLYAPHIRYVNGTLIENTDYGAFNPDLPATTTCFGRDWRTIYHAGIDYYDSRIDPNNPNGGGINGVQVKAIADGVVVWYDPSVDWVPGRAIVIRHPQPVGGDVYAVYMHIGDVAIPAVLPGGSYAVSRGTVLGTVSFNSWVGAPGNAQYHANMNDSHLHFEIRSFASNEFLYSGYPSCYVANVWPGRGYTWPNHPDQNQSSSGVKVYYDPDTIFGQNQFRWLIPSIGR